MGVFFLAAHAYVLSKYMSGMSKNDVELDVSQMESGGSYAIDDYCPFIAYDMYCSLGPFLHPDYSEETIYGLFSVNNVYRLKSYGDDGAAVVTSVRIGGLHTQIHVIP